jgi:hypothetical protein
MTMYFTDRVLADFDSWCTRRSTPGDSLELQHQRAFVLDSRARWGGRTNPLLWRSSSRRRWADGDLLHQRAHEADAAAPVLAGLRVGGLPAGSERRTRQVAICQSSG